MRLFLPVIVLLCVVTDSTICSGETLRQAVPLGQLLQAAPLSDLVKEAKLRGDARRGALVFYKSAAACVNCHSSGEISSPLGPDLAVVGRDEDGKPVSDEHLIDSLLRPSKSIRKGYETVRVLETDGQVVSGLLVADRDDEIVLRDASDLQSELVVPKDEIESKQLSEKSMMPEGLMASLSSQREFLDLAKYVIEVARGGAERAAELKPSPEDLVVEDDSINLDHARIIQKFGSRDFETGQRIYHGYCFNCHGSDGNTPSLPTARAFGTQKLKFGADPYRMFMTLTKGNGLMAPMSHLTPKERYQVVHYIREQFMKDTNPDYVAVDKQYLQELPEGTEDGTRVEPVVRDFGPALASQLERQYSSVLTVDVDGISVSYNLHSMDLAGIWKQGFLDLSETQHARDRGEGTANPAGKPIEDLSLWLWGHDGTLDYPRGDLLPRGPMPRHWMDYRGHYLHGDEVVLSYAIDGRDIFELPRRGPVDTSITHLLKIHPGDELVLGVARVPDAKQHQVQMVGLDGEIEQDSNSNAIETLVLIKPAIGNAIVASVAGDTQQMTWAVDDKQRIVLKIPQDVQTRMVQVTIAADCDGPDIKELSDSLRNVGEKDSKAVDPETFTSGGELLWPDVLTTVGYRGLQQGAYVLDTLTLPESTPWNTWFRTSAVDFFADGRMALATYGGDVWIVSGIDDQLLNLKWKRFAAGLYEPMGVRVVNETVYVTCKDRLTRLHDADGNGEADFYESFSADEDVSVNFHAFNFDLQTDNEGNFYYAKSGHGTDSSIPGCVIQVTADGTQRSIYCTGFRTPNGMGVLPDGRVTASDNQGQWTPAGKINLL
ncbi:MAG: hypothetical protein HKN47_15855, partial [Pirellulaceae bacterium]|nr:hypothetical protein [Pirellulaceae bacterium]